LLVSDLTEAYERRDWDAVIHAARHSRQFPDVRGRGAEQRRNASSDRPTVSKYVVRCGAIISLRGFVTLLPYIAAKFPTSAHTRCF